MSFTNTPIVYRTSPRPQNTTAAVARYLLDRSEINAEDLPKALIEKKKTNATLADIAIRNAYSSEQAALSAQANFFSATVFSLKKSQPDANLVKRLSPAFCLKHAVLPWGHIGDAIFVATSMPDKFEAIREELQDKLGPVVMALTSEEDIQAVITELYSERLAEEAETRVPDHASCRDFNRWTAKRASLGAFCGVFCISTVLIYPMAFFTAVLIVAMATLAMSQLTKLLALFALKGRTKPPPLLDLKTYPYVSLLVPLFHEKDIAGALVKRLSRLTYPKSQLDVALVLEANDTTTQKTLAHSQIPPWIRVIVVPPGTIQTKPRALNYALNFCRGDIIGIYDAEDAPAPDQIEQVVSRFENGRQDLACVQAILDFYNTKANWLSRCFSIEYASWFRVMLPGYSRLGFAVPLGGTSVFFKRPALEEVCGWDAHNVTEDADLGIRLARFGYRTELLDTVTREEANNRGWPWVKQRSRWLKGYMITYLVHMRHPSRLWHDLGPRKFLGFQLIFLTAILQFVLAPVLWSFWLVSLGTGHPLEPMLPEVGLSAMIAVFLVTEAISLAIGITAVSLSPHTKLLPWVPTMMLYFPLGALASYKAIYELIFRPFFWDKTMHGHSQPDGSL